MNRRVVIHRCLLNLLPIAASVLLTFFGGFVLHLIEEPEEIRRKLDPNSDAIVSSRLDWNFWGAVSYVMSVFTTIGNDDRRVETHRGRAFVVLFAVVSIPTFIASLYVCSKLLANLLLRLTDCCHRLCRCCGRKASEWRPIPTNVNSPGDRWLWASYHFPIWAVLLALIVYLAVCPALILLTEKLLNRETSDLTVANTYANSAWFFFISFLSVGNEDLRMSPPLGQLISYLLVIGAFLLVATVIQLICGKIDATVDQLHQTIDERYRRSLMLGHQGAMAVGPDDVHQSLRALLRYQPLPNRFWFLFVGDRRRQQLRDHWSAKANMRTTTVQTETDGQTFVPRGIGALKEEVRKSHDDVNSLVAMIDYSFVPRKFTSIQVPQ